MKPLSSGTSSCEHSVFNLLSRLPTADRWIRTADLLKSKSVQRNPRISLIRKPKHSAISTMVRWGCANASSIRQASFTWRMRGRFLRL